MLSNNDVQLVLEKLLKDPSPKIEDRIMETIKSHERILRQLVDRGWTPAKIAAHLKASGLAASKEQIRKAIIALLEESNQMIHKAKSKGHTSISKQL